MTGEALTLEGFNLLMGDDFTNANEFGCLVNVLGDGATFGNAAARTKVLTSMMRNGELTVDDGAGNRNPKFQVCIEGPNLDAVSQTEKKLGRLVLRPATLRWQPPDVLSKPCVFDVLWSNLEYEFDDVQEVRHVRRYFTLTIEALPYARDENLTTIPAVPIPPTTVVNTVVDDCTVIGNWSGSPNTATVTAGAVAVYSGLGASTMSLTRTGAVTLTGTPYLVIRATTEFVGVNPTGYVINPQWASIGLHVAGVATDFNPIAASPQANGYIDYYFNVSGVTIGASGFGVYAVWPNAANVGATLRVDQVRRTSQLPLIGGRKQQTRSFDVGGSAPTEGSIHLSHATGPFDETLVYTYPRRLKYLPPLSPYYVSGGAGPTADAPRFTGQWRALSSPINYDVPAPALPAGSYNVVAFMYAPTTGGYQPFDLTVQSRMGGGAVGRAMTTHPVPLMVANTWQMYLLDQITIPTPVGIDGFLRITLGKNAAATVTPSVDEVWLCHTDGQLTILNYSGTNARHLWIDAPSQRARTGGLFVGTDPDRSDQWSMVGNARHASQHVMDVDGTSLFTAVHGADDVAADFTFYRRHLHHAVAEL